MGNIKQLQEGLAKLWTDELYSADFKASPLKYKDFDHALKHVLKAAVQLQNFTEEIDHSGDLTDFPIDSAKKYIADLVICAVRLANVNPNGSVDLETIVFDRIRRKMGTELNTEPDLIAVLRRIRNARAEGCSTGEAMSKIECWAREAMTAAGVPE